MRRIDRDFDEKYNEKREKFVAARYARFYDRTNDRETPEVRIAHAQQLTIAAQLEDINDTLYEILVVLARRNDTGNR